MNVLILIAEGILALLVDIFTIPFLLLGLVLGGRGVLRYRKLKSM